MDKAIANVQTNYAMTGAKASMVIIEESKSMWI